MDETRLFIIILKKKKYEEQIIKSAKNNLTNISEEK